MCLKCAKQHSALLASMRRLFVFISICCIVLAASPTLRTESKVSDSERKRAVNPIFMLINHLCRQYYYNKNDKAIDVKDGLWFNIKNLTQKVKVQAKRLWSVYENLVQKVFDAIWSVFKYCIVDPLLLIAKNVFGDVIRDLLKKREEACNQRNKEWEANQPTPSPIIEQPEEGSLLSAVTECIKKTKEWLMATPSPSPSLIPEPIAEDVEQPEERSFLWTVLNDFFSELRGGQSEDYDSI